MDSKTIEHIKFLLIDSINDDVQGLYELNNSVNMYYQESALENDFVRGEILLELITEKYVRVVKMTNPEFEVIEIVENETVRNIALDKSNWTNYQNDWIYGIQSRFCRINFFRWKPTGFKPIIKLLMTETS